MPLNETIAQAKRDKWRRFISRIEPQVFRMMDFRRWNRAYERIVNANPRLLPGNPVLDYFRSIYADYAALAVRRQAKPHRDSISLLGLIDDLAIFAEAMTLGSVIDLYLQPLPSGHKYPTDVARFLAESTFKQFAIKSGNTLDPAIPTTDAAALRAATKNIVTIVDGTIAHDDKTIPQVESSFNELDEAIVLIASLTRKYTLLLTGAAFIGMTPIDQTNAIDVFSFPWIDGSHPLDLNVDDL